MTADVLDHEAAKDEAGHWDECHDCHVDDTHEYLVPGCADCDDIRDEAYFQLFGVRP